MPASSSATGGDEPVVVMAYGANGDFSFLDLRRPAFDLTDRGVGGRAFARPRRRVPLYRARRLSPRRNRASRSRCLRDRVGAAVDAPLTLVANRPDGVEVRAHDGGRRIAHGGHDDVVAGAEENRAAWPLADRRPTSIPRRNAIGRVQFDVADFVPQRLKVALTPQETVLHPNMDMHIRAESRFLYGAPASGLSGEGEARITTDPDPYPQFATYQFGRMDDSFSDVDGDAERARHGRCGRDRSHRPRSATSPTRRCR